MMGFKVTCVEAKGIWSPKLGRYIPGRTKPGTSDILMCDKDGVFMAIEVKAFGKKKNLTESQQDYLKDIILRNGFAVCVDNVKDLDQVYNQWKRSVKSEGKFILLQRLNLV